MEKTKKVGKDTNIPHLTISERLKLVRRKRGLTQQEMANLLTIARPTVAQLEGGRHQPSNEVLETIISKLDISRDWLWFGTGEMEENFSIGHPARLMSLSVEVEYIDCPLIPVPARAAFMEMVGQEVGYSHFKTVRIYNPSPELLQGEPLVFELDGDSMEPQLRPGMQVAVMPLPLENSKYVVSGVYVVAFSNQLIVKRIKDNDILTKGQLTLHSDNPKAGSLTVESADLRGLWKVIDIIRGRVE